MEAGSLVLAGFAMLSAVGRSYPESCASIRAGLSRPTALPGTQLIDEESQQAVPVVGHPVRGVTEGFFGPGLWLRLAQHCLAELMHRSVVAPPQDEAYWSRSALLVLTPDPNGERFDPDEPHETEYVRRMVLEPLLRRTPLRLQGQACFTISAGQATLYGALAKAGAQIRAGRFDRFVVLAVDSLLDDLSLAWLNEQGRLKGPDSPSGLMPGEVGVGMVIERAGTGVSDPRTQVALLGLEHATRAGTALSLPGTQGARLAGVVDAALAQARLGSAAGGTIVCDLNGEVWKAETVAHARMALIGHLNDNAEWVMPCASLGDVGSASAAVTVAVASWYALRVRQQAGSVLALGIQRDGDVGAMVLGALH